MTITVTVPAVVAIVGALVYVLSANGKLVEMGRLMFGCGLLATLLVFGRALIVR